MWETLTRLLRAPLGLLLWSLPKTCSHPSAWFLSQTLFSSGGWESKNQVLANLPSDESYHPGLFLKSAWGQRTLWEARSWGHGSRWGSGGWEVKMVGVKYGEHSLRLEELLHTRPPEVKQDLWWVHRSLACLRGGTGKLSLGFETWELRPVSFRETRGLDKQPIGVTRVGWMKALVPSLINLQCLRVLTLELVHGL